MHQLRSSQLLTRLVLACFVLVLAVAGLSPVVHPKSMEIVCSAGGAVKIVVSSDDGQAAEMGQHALDCSLCLAAVLPATPSRFPTVFAQPLAHALLPAVAAHIAALVGAPLPARGPPSLIA